MAEATALREELDAWCSSYITAFEAFNVKAIGAHWLFPAMVVSGGRQLIMKDAASFDRNTSALTNFYKAQNATRVQRTVLSCHMMLEQSAAMRVKDIISTAQNEPITEWVSAYVLRKTQLGWRAIFADATGEADAWAARGTPLGS